MIPANDNDNYETKYDQISYSLAFAVSLIMKIAGVDPSDRSKAHELLDQLIDKGVALHAEAKAKRQ